MKPGLLVISHGSREAGWVALVEEAVAAARVLLGDSLPVEAGFLELVDGRLIQDGIDRLEAAGVDRLLALPLFVSSGSTHVDEIGWALGAYPEPKAETDLEPYRVAAQLTYGEPMDDDPELIGVVLERLREMIADSDPGELVLLLVGHGSEIPEFREAWERGLESVASRAAREIGLAEGAVALLLPNQVPERLAELKEKHPGRETLVLPLFLSEGYFTKDVVPRRLKSGGVDGKSYRYTGRALMPHPNLAAWIARKTREWLSAIDKNIVDR